MIKLKNHYKNEDEKKLQKDTINGYVYLENIIILNIYIYGI